MRLVLLETSGNQRYIFATNKLRENIGASELTWAAGARWVIEEADDLDARTRWSDEPNERRRRLLSPRENPPAEQAAGDAGGFEILVASSGKALILVGGDAEASDRLCEELVWRVTRRALQQAPGLDVCGLYSRWFDWSAETLHEVSRELHRDFESVRVRRAGPDLRFLRLPPIADCASSGLPAARSVRNAAGRLEGRSAISQGKHEVAEAAHARLLRVPGGRTESERADDETTEDLGGLTLARNLTHLDEVVQSLDWLGVIHADGNGIGSIFHDFDKLLWPRPSDLSEPNSTGADTDRTKSTDSSNREYAEALRAFSIGLDVCTDRAFRRAAAAMAKESEREELPSSTKARRGKSRVVPIVPLILGGDDLTVLCDGRHALGFARTFLIEFELASSDAGLLQGLVEDSWLHGIVARIAERAFQSPRLSACAGVALVKPHFPFSQAYRLAEQLTESAKRVKAKVVRGNGDGASVSPWPCSALDFHVLYDSSDADLKRIRAHWTRESEGGGKVRLYLRPYVVTDMEKIEVPRSEPTSGGRAWAARRTWSSLERRASLLRARGSGNHDETDGRRVLPNSQVHDLRRGLFLGREQADARYRLILHRYQAKGLAELGNGVQLSGPEAGHGTAPPSEYADRDPSLFFRDGENWETGLLDAMDATEFLPGAGGAQ